ADSRKPI
nr:RecName: Full=Dermonecrotic toxin LgSicTox-beta-LOXN3; AltName: Full=Phospholipase D; Short=PLD; AltName: Full=Sphingomyelin phosphodiesterase D; Short=SMD; Short=SMase D; Short=Sphingomyelinase D [Loxosceles gaucho]